MSFLKKLFGFSAKKKENDFDPIARTVIKIEASKLKCVNESKKAQNEIDFIFKEAKKIILEIFDVPSEFWYEELKKYEKIKSLEKNLKINKTVINRCDLIINGYKEQIEIKKSKIKFNKKLLIKYEEIEKKLNTTINKIKRDKIEKKQLKLLEKHRQIISEMNNENRDNNLKTKNDELFNLANDIQLIDDELKFKTELQNEFEEVENELNSNLSNNSIQIKNNIDKLINKIE